LTFLEVIVTFAPLNSFKYGDYNASIKGLKMTSKASSIGQVVKMEKTERNSLDSLTKSIMSLTAKIGKLKSPQKGK
jgi:hypothetical protein